MCQNSVNLYDEILEGYNHQVCNFYELTSFNNDASFVLIFVFLSQIRLLPPQFMESLFKKLNSNGILIFPVINTNLITLHKSENIREICAKYNHAINSIIRLPEKSLFNTNIDVQLILITKKTTDFEYIFEFADFYNSNLDEGLINKGLNILCNSFSEKFITF